MPQSNRRQLGLEEARKLLKVDAAEQIDKERKELGKWPGSYNLKLLAQAVDRRHKTVIFEPYQKFNIKYSEKYKAVFIRPEKGFVPCGWFSYDRIKYILAEIGDEDD